MEQRQRDCEKYRAYEIIAKAWGTGKKRTSTVGVTALFFSIVGFMLVFTFLMALIFNVLALVFAIWDIRRPRNREVIDVVSIVISSISIILGSLFYGGVIAFDFNEIIIKAGVLGAVTIAELILCIVSVVMCILVIIDPKYAVIHQLKEKRGKALLTWFLIGLAAFILYIIMSSISFI